MLAQTASKVSPDPLARGAHLRPALVRERHVGRPVVADTRPSGGLAVMNQNHTPERSLRELAHACPLAANTAGAPRLRQAEQGRLRTRLRFDARPHAPSRFTLIEAALRGRLVKRYKRFLADVGSTTGYEETVHCPSEHARDPDARVRRPLLHVRQPSESPGGRCWR